jgi:hypothetical protein
MLMQPKYSSTPKYGFSILKNGLKYDYPFLESFSSLNHFTQNIYLALGDSEDQTDDIISKNFPEANVIHTTWDHSLKDGHVLSVETNVALNFMQNSLKVKNDDAWGVYLQADEVLHEEDLELFHRDLDEAMALGYDAVSFQYLHFWLDHFHIATMKRWYPCEIRAIRLNGKIQSYGDAQSFVGHKKIYDSKVRIYHYGHVRDQSVYLKKMEDMSLLYHPDAEQSKYYNAKDRLHFEDKRNRSLEDNQCLLYLGSHPQWMHKRIKRLEFQNPLLTKITEFCPHNDLVIITKHRDISPQFIKTLPARSIYWVEDYFSARQYFSSHTFNEDPIVINMLDEKKIYFFHRYGQALKLFELIMTPWDRLIQSLRNYFFSIPAFSSTGIHKMRSKKSQEWPSDLKLILKLSERGIGFKMKST